MRDAHKKHKKPSSVVFSKSCSKTTKLVFCQTGDVKLYCLAMNESKVTEKNVIKKTYLFPAQNSITLFECVLSEHLNTNAF